MAQRVDFTFSSGRKVATSEAQAKLLKRLGKGDYLTRDMADQPVLVKAAPAPDAEVRNEDGLDDMDMESLHALAKERGVYVHHRAGADRVREALRAAT